MEYTPDYARLGYEMRQPPCIWMSAGVLSYQLCEREFECERCPLDAAMRMHQSRVAPVRGQHGRTVPALAADCLYSSSHCWIKKFGEGVRVGIEPGLAALIPPPTTVVLPAPEIRLHRGQPCIWLLTGEELLRLRSPMDGVVSAVHEGMSERWKLLNDDPYAAGWLYEIAAASGELESHVLMDSLEATRKFADDAAKFKTLATMAFQSDESERYLTMQDGGELAHEVSKIVGSKRYLAILREVFGM